MSAKLNLDGIYTTDAAVKYDWSMKRTAELLHGSTL